MFVWWFVSFSLFRIAGEIFSINSYSVSLKLKLLKCHNVDWIRFFCNWFWIINGICGMIHGASHSFVLAISFHWNAFWDVLLLACFHRFNPLAFLLVILPQLDIIPIYQKKDHYSPNRTHGHFQKSGNAHGNKWGWAHPVLSDRFLYEDIYLAVDSDLFLNIFTVTLQFRG